MKNNAVANLDKRAYGNILVVSPDDIKMFYTNNSRLRFYLKNNLVEQIDENTYRLLFKPNGLGYSARGAFNVTPRLNRCVVTGEDDLTLLTKHHIVPTFFRKHFPIKEKSNYQFLVLITREKHNDYTTEEHRFFDVLADKYDVPPISDFRYNIDESRKISGIARSLFLYGDKIPLEAKENLMLAFKHGTGLESNITNYQKYAKDHVVEKHKGVSTVENNFGKAIADKITDYREFERMWLGHFIETMQPKFMPDDLIKSF